MSDVVSLPIVDTHELVRVLADFIVWAERPSHENYDQEYYSSKARNFLEVRGVRTPQFASEPVTALCMRCGEHFRRTQTTRPEPFSGYGLLLCKPCLSEETLLYGLLGDMAYKAQWRYRQAKGEFHV